MTWPPDSLLPSATLSAAQKVSELGRILAIVLAIWTFTVACTRRMPEEVRIKRAGSESALIPRSSFFSVCDDRDMIFFIERRQDACKKQTTTGCMQKANNVNVLK